MFNNIKKIFFVKNIKDKTINDKSLFLYALPDINYQDKICFDLEHYIQEIINCRPFEIYSLTNWKNFNDIFIHFTLIGGELNNENFRIELPVFTTTLSHLKSLRKSLFYTEMAVLFTQTDNANWIRLFSKELKNNFDWNYLEMIAKDDKIWDHVLIRISNNSETIDKEEQINIYKNFNLNLNNK